MSKHLVLSVKPYDFTNKNEERIIGAKISYINKKPSSRDGEQGYPPLLVSLNDLALVDKFQEVPGVYDMEFEQVTGKNNKPEIILTDVELFEPVDLGQFF